MNNLLLDEIVYLEITDLKPGRYYVEVLVEGDDPAPPLLPGAVKFLRPGKFEGSGVFEGGNGAPVAFPSHPRVRYREVPLQNTSS